MLNKDLEKKQEYFWNSWQNKIVREKLDNSVIPQNKEESYKIIDALFLKGGADTDNKDNTLENK